jgi:Regulator of chromosome condensation (RCC1) repeat
MAGSAPTLRVVCFVMFWGGGRCDDRRVATSRRLEGVRTKLVCVVAAIGCYGCASTGTAAAGVSAPVVPQAASIIAAGSGHTCALQPTGQIECWGENEYGQLGDGTFGSSATPVEVKGITNATQVTAEAEETCALLSTGHVECWGRNDSGQLGNGTTVKSDTPAAVVGTDIAGPLRSAATS